MSAPIRYQGRHRKIGVVARPARVHNARPYSMGPYTDPLAWWRGAWFVYGGLTVGLCCDVRYGIVPRLAESVLGAALCWALIGMPPALLRSAVRRLRAKSSSTSRRRFFGWSPAPHRARVQLPPTATRALSPELAPGVSRPFEALDAPGPNRGVRPNASVVHSMARCDLAATSTPHAAVIGTSAGPARGSPGEDRRASLDPDARRPGRVPDAEQ